MNGETYVYGEYVYYTSGPGEDTEVAIVEQVYGDGKYLIGFAHSENMIVVPTSTLKR